MSGQVKRNEVYQDNFYGPLGDSAKDARAEIGGLTADLIEQSNVLEKDLKKSMTNNIKGINKFLELVKKANKLKVRAIELDKSEARAIKLKTLAEVESGKIKRDKLKTEAQEIRNSQLLERQKIMQANAEKRAAKVAAAESDAYKQLSKRTREQKNESKRLSVEMINLTANGERNSKAYREVASQYRKVTKEARQGDKVLKKIDGTVGDNFRNVGNYASGLDKLKGSFRRIAGALGLFTALRGVTGIVVDFDQSVADLGAISADATEDELKRLTDQAKELGATSQFSATQITEMQIELSKLGFTAQQIQSSTKSVSDFAAATGAEIPQAAQLAGSAMRAFGLDADEMSRVVSTLGVATTKTALNFEFLQTGLSTVAPVAKSFGFSIEDTTALLGQLANSGFDASSAATATRNILLNLADSSGDLAKELGRPIKNADDLAGALQELDARGIDLASALELTDKRSVAAFQTFVEGAGTIGDLKESITGVNDELEDMAEKRLDTISGQFTLLKSAWEGFILSVNEGSGAGETIKSFLGFLADNLPTIVKWVGRLVKLFLIYKARIIAMNTAQRLFNDGSGKMNVSMKTLIKNFKDGSTEGAGFGKVMRGIGWTALIGFALELGSAFWDMASGADAAADKALRLKKIEDEGRTQREAFNKKFARQLKEQQQQRDQRIATAKDQIEIDKRAGLSAQEALDKQTASIKRANDAYKEFIDGKNGFGQSRIETLNSEINTLESHLAVALSDLEIAKELGRDVKKFEAERKIKELEEAIKLNKSEIELRKQASEDLSEEGEETKKFTKTVSGHTKAVKENNTEFRNRINLLDELNNQTNIQIELMGRLREVQSSEKVAQAQDLIDAQIVLQKMRIETELAFDFPSVKRLILERQKLEIQAIIERRDFEINSLEQASASKFAKMREDLNKEHEALISQANLTDAELLKIEATFAAEMEKIRKIEEADRITLEENAVVIKEQANNEILDNERQTAGEIHDINLELTSDLSGLLDQQAEAEKRSEEEKIKAAQDAAKRRREIAKTLTSFLDKQSDKRISQIEKEIDARQAQFDRYETLAVEDSITQEQSLKAQKKAINELEKQKAAEERAKQRRQLINTTYSVYQSHVEAGDENPLAETITDISLLQALISTIPAFIDGTDTTVAAALGAPMMSGKDGYIVRVDGNEKILNPELSAMTGDHTTTDIARIVSDYDRGKLMNAAQSSNKSGSNWQSAALMGKLTSLEKAYRDTPDFASKLEELSDQVAYLVTTRKEGNKTFETRRRIYT